MAKKTLSAESASAETEVSNPAIAADGKPVNEGPEVKIIEPVKNNKSRRAKKSGEEVSEQQNSQSPAEQKKPRDNSAGIIVFRIFAAVVSLGLIAIAVLDYIKVIDLVTYIPFLKDYAALAPLAVQAVLTLIVIFMPAFKKNVVIQEIKQVTEVAETESDAPEVLVPIPDESEYKPAKIEVDATPINFDKYNKTDLEEINGGLYAEVIKYDEKIKVLEKLGATDLDIIQTNMSGNTKFDEILKTQRTQNTMTAKEICSYAMTKKGIVTIKKRGAINWTFKYGAKSFMMIREGKDCYKVSIKCFPDAAVKLNEVFKALEDSNFPAGPVWFCFSELRNLPPKVVKWLIDTAYQIAVMQQTKTDILREPKPLSHYDIDGEFIKDSYMKGQNTVKCGKFTLVFQKGAKADMGCLLVKPPKNLDTSKFIKELYYKFIFNSELSVTMLPDKGVGEEMINTFFENIENIMLKSLPKPVEAPKAETKQRVSLSMIDTGSYNPDEDEEVSDLNAEEVKDGVGEDDEE